MNRLRNLAAFLVTIVILGFLLLHMRSIALPLYFAAFFSFLLLPLQNRILSLVRLDGLAIILSMLLVIFGFILIVFLFGRQFVIIMDDLPSITKTVTNGIEQLLVWLQNQLPFLELDSRTFLEDNVSTIVEAPLQFLRSGISTSAATILGFALCFIFTFFCLYYRAAFRNFVILQFPRYQRGEISNILNTVKKLIQKYLIGLLSVIGILSILNSVGLLIIGVDYAVFWGVLAAFLVIIPYIGTTLGGTFPFLYALATTTTVWQPIAVVALYFGIQQLEGNFITPKVVGSSVSVNPFFALISIITMGFFLGIAGIVLALPTIAIIKLLCDNIEPLQPVGAILDSNIRKEENLLAKFDHEKYRLSSLFSSNRNK